MSRNKNYQFQSRTWPDHSGERGSAVFALMVAAGVLLAWLIFSLIMGDIQEGWEDKNRHNAEEYRRAREVQHDNDFQKRTRSRRATY